MVSFLFLLKIKNMKKLILPLIIIVVIIAFYVPKSSPYYIIVKVIAITVLMIGVMKLMQKIPSKNQEKNDDDV